jgi:8-oxo-dGTP pyrophosphatase MutT (NUDIX family)
LSERAEQVLAAVLVPVFRDPDGELRLVLTKRRADLRRHAGEISFPGGRRDPSDSDLTETALREAEEEIGLPRTEAHVIAALTPTSTFATNYTIHPFVAMLAHDPSLRRWQPSEREVETVLEPSLASLSSARGLTTVSRRGFTFETDAYLFDGQVVWGATARILDDLLARAPKLFGDYSGPLATGTPTRLPHSVQEPS